MHVKLFIWWSCELLNASRYDTGLKLMWKISFCVMKHTAVVNLVFFAHMPLQLFHLNIMNFCYFLTDSVAAIYVNVLRLQNFLNLFHLSLGFIHFLFAFLLLCYYQMIYRPCKIYSNWKYFTLRKLWVALIKSWKNLRSALLVLRKPRVGLKFALRVLYPHCRPQGPSLFS